MPSRLLINSLPKSGTHLLAKAAELSNYTEHFSNNDSSTTPMFLNYRAAQGGLREAEQQTSVASETIQIGSQTPVAVPATIFRRWLDGLAPQQYILGHVAWSPILSAMLKDLKYKHLFIIRDPRAVVVSLLSFIHDTIGMPKPHFLQADFRAMTFDQQLDCLLQGGYASSAQVDITPFAVVYHNMLSWRDDPNCLFLHFEDLVGPSGGGSTVRQQQAVQAIASHLGQVFDKEQCAGIYSTTARTFRKGSIDSWKAALDKDALQKLNEYCEPLCEAAGYAHDA